MKKWISLVLIVVAIVTAAWFFFQPREEKEKKEPSPSHTEPKTKEKKKEKVEKETPTKSPENEDISLNTLSKELNYAPTPWTEEEKQTLSTKETKDIKQVTYENQKAMENMLLIFFKEGTDKTALEKIAEETGAYMASYSNFSQSSLFVFKEGTTPEQLIAIKTLLEKQSGVTSVSYNVITEIVD